MTVIECFYLTDDTNIKKAAESLNEMARRQVTCIKTCAECFEYWANDVADFFSRVCTKPHLICYAKMDGYPYWPAKVLRINGGMANCEFFGDHSQADIPLTHCFLYSEEFDGKNTRNRSFNKALEVTNHILSNSIPQTLDLFKFHSTGAEFAYCKNRGKIWFV